jgi:hypothetical protein
MRWALIAISILVWVRAGYGISGDLNSDGTVDFHDFFMLADNFGKSGPAEVVDTLKVTIYDTLVVEIQRVVFDTLVIDQATVYDTVILGREPIRFDPPPPLYEIAQKLQVAGRLVPRMKALNGTTFRQAEFLGEITNPTAAALSDLTVRLTVRDQEGFILNTARGGVPLLFSGDTRPFEVSILEGENISENIRNGNFMFDVAFEEPIEKVGNVSLGIKPGSVRYTVPFGIVGEIQNTSDLTVRSFSIHFYGRDDSGNPTYLNDFSERDFSIPPGGSSPFSTYAMKRDFETYIDREEISELFFFISWSWTTSGQFEYEQTPLTRMF